MLNIKRIQVNILEENCYIVNDETLEAVVIDCGALSEDDRKQITNYIESKHLDRKSVV